MSSLQNAISKILAFSRKYQLLERGDHLLAAVSGGPDSVFLSKVLANLQSEIDLSIHVAHVNYHLRGSESDADLAFVEQMATKNSWPLHCSHADPDEHKVRGGNLQEWARTIRIQFFNDTLIKHHLNKVVLGHHLTDQIETFLLRLLRGSGPSGLASMRPKTIIQNTTYIRPLLCLTRDEIQTVMTDNKIDSREDKSNRSQQYRRNQLRQEILPRLAKIHENYEKHAGQTLLLMQEEDRYLQLQALSALDDLKAGIDHDTACDALNFSRAGFKDLPRVLRLRVLREAIVQLTGDRQSITFHHIKKVEDLACLGPSNAHYDLPGLVSYEQKAQIMSLVKKPYQASS